MEAAWGQVKVARDLAMIRAQVKPREFTAADWAASTRATGRCGSSMARHLCAGDVGMGAIVRLPTSA
jgi:hypothetical protein